jgi:hypothetical protein
MEPHQLDQAAVLRDQLNTREGTVQALKDTAINTLMIAQVAQAYCVQKHQEGQALDTIPLLGRLPMFWNSAGRALQAYLATLDKGKTGIITAEDVIEAITNDDKSS